MLLRHLKEAERHVAEGEKHIALQEQIVADLARVGHDTVEARKLLDNFYASQVQHIQHRDRILRELEQAGNAPH
jgi:ferritin